MRTDNTRDRLLRAAALEVARHGIKGASMRGVAGRAEIKAASIFHYFPGGKDELMRAMLRHILQTIATRMTPTIEAGSTLPPAELIEQCAAQLWDFLGEHPEYAGALMRQALEPEEAIVDVVRDNAKNVLDLALAYFAAAQASGDLAVFEPRRFLHRLATHALGFHAGPSMRTTILGADWSADAERQAFLAWVRAEVSPR